MEKHNFRLGEEVSSGEEKLIFSPFSSSRSGKEGEESIKKFPVIDSSTFFFLDAADSGQFFSWTSVAFWEGNRNKFLAIYVYYFLALSDLLLLQDIFAAMDRSFSFLPFPTKIGQKNLHEKNTRGKEPAVD